MSVLSKKKKVPTKIATIDQHADDTQPNGHLATRTHLSPAAAAETFEANDAINICNDVDGESIPSISTLIQHGNWKLQ